jgi:hydroxymethylglutaryl-CoA synthase
MRGVLGWGTYVPHRRLDRTTIRAVAGSGGGKGTRAVASYDEDTTTLGVAAARSALRSVGVRPGALWFTTTAPTYLDKTNASAVHAALRLDRDTAAYDAVGATRSVFASLAAALDGRMPVLVVSSDLRVGLPGGTEEATAGDAAAAVVFGDDADAPVLAEVVARASLTEEFLDRWRVPGDASSRTW